jgi:SAM-dependent methyltransferase
MTTESAKDSTGTRARDQARNGPRQPSPWVTRFAGLVPSGGPVLDVACGGGRHTRLFLDRGHPVTAVDADISRVADLADEARAEIVEADLENGAPWPFTGRSFAGIVVTNYLYRPLFPVLMASLATGGVLIYETFALGNERFGKPRNPDHLLRPGELLDAVHGVLQVVAYEFGTVRRRRAALGRLCAVKPADAEAPPYPLDPAES